MFLSTFGSEGQFCGPFNLWVLVLVDNSFDGPFIVSALGYWFWGTTVLMFMSALIGTGYWFRGTTIDVPNNLRVLFWGTKVLMFLSGGGTTVLMFVSTLRYWLGGGRGGQVLMFCCFNFVNVWLNQMCMLINSVTLL